MSKTVIFFIKLIFFLISIVIFFVIDAFLSSRISYFLQYLIFCVPISLIFVCIKNIYPDELKLKEKLVIHFVISFLVLIAFDHSTNRTDRRLGIKKLNYSKISCFQTFRGVMSNKGFYQIIQNQISKLDYSTQYLIVMGTDRCRVSTILVTIKTNKLFNKICPNKNRVECLRMLHDFTLANKPLSILSEMQLIGELGFLNQVDQYIRNKSNLDEKNKIKDNLIYSVSTFKAMYELLDKYNKNVQFEQFFDKFPSLEISNLSQESKNVMDVAFKLADNKTLSSKTIKQLLKVERKIVDIHPQVMEAYMLKNVDKDMRSKLNQSLCSKILDGLEKIKTELAGSVNSRKLSAADISEVKELASSTQSQIVCKN